MTYYQTDPNEVKVRIHDFLGDSIILISNLLQSSELSEEYRKQWAEIQIALVAIQSGKLDFL